MSGSCSPGPLHDSPARRSPFVGSGAKAQVSLRADGDVQSAYVIWRDVEEIGTVTARSADEVAAAFGSMPGFERLTDDTARVEVTSAVAGVYALPPTEASRCSTRLWS